MSNPGRVEARDRVPTEASKAIIKPLNQYKHMTTDTLLEERKLLLEDIKSTQNQNEAILAIKAKMRGITPEQLKTQQLNELNNRLDEINSELSK